MLRFSFFTNLYCVTCIYIGSDPLYMRETFYMNRQYFIWFFSSPFSFYFFFHFLLLYFIPYEFVILCSISLERRPTSLLYVYVHRVANLLVLPRVLFANRLFVFDKCLLHGRVSTKYINDILWTLFGLTDMNCAHKKGEKACHKYRNLTLQICLSAAVRYTNPSWHIYTVETENPMANIHLSRLYSSKLVHPNPHYHSNLCRWGKKRRTIRADILLFVNKIFQFYDYSVHSYRSNALKRQILCNLLEYSKYRSMLAPSLIHRAIISIDMPHARIRPCNSICKCWHFASMAITIFDYSMEENE